MSKVRKEECLKHSKHLHDEWHSLPARVVDAEDGGRERVASGTFRNRCVVLVSAPVGNTYTHTTTTTTAHVKTLLPAAALALLWQQRHQPWLVVRVLRVEAIAHVLTNLRFRTRQSRRATPHNSSRQVTKTHHCVFQLERFCALQHFDLFVAEGVAVSS